MHVSLDGYVRDAGGEVGDWVFRTYDDELARWEVELLWQAGTHVMGRRLYEEMAAHWPTSTEVFARPMNEIPKVVFSRSLRHADWQHTRIADGDPGAELDRLRREPGKDIRVHGGATLAQSLARLGAIDEYRLIVHPVALAGGLALFDAPMDLALTATHAFPAGAAALTYARRPAVNGSDA
jgi:dihydrofolate reductase